MTTVVLVVFGLGQTADSGPPLALFDLDPRDLQNSVLALESSALADQFALVAEAEQDFVVESGLLVAEVVAYFDSLVEGGLA